MKLATNHIVTEEQRIDTTIFTVFIKKSIFKIIVSVSLKNDPVNLSGEKGKKR